MIKCDVRNYRRITLLDTSYKLYAIILKNRLRKEEEKLKILPETQAGFRRGRSCIDKIYVLKTIAEKAKSKKGNLYTFFADLKIAFDKINKGKLWENLKEKGIDRKLVSKIEEIYKETRCRVTVNKKESEVFNKG